MAVANETAGEANMVAERGQGAVCFWRCADRIQEERFQRIHYYLDIANFVDLYKTIHTYLEYVVDTVRQAHQPEAAVPLHGLWDCNADAIFLTARDHLPESPSHAP